MTILGTLEGVVFDRAPAVDYRRVWLETPDGDNLAVDFLVRSCFNWKHKLIAKVTTTSIWTSILLLDFQRYPAFIFLVFCINLLSFAQSLLLFVHPVRTHPRGHSMGNGIGRSLY